LAHFFSSSQRQTGTGGEEVIFVWIISFHLNF
jgi:hypothetical protein